MDLEDLRLQLAKLGKKNLYFFCKAILGYDRLSSNLHREICWAVENDAFSKRLIIVPRGHYKSTIATKGRSIQKLAQDPNERILITSATATNAQRFLRHIKAHFEQNAIFRWVYPELIPEFTKTTWSNTEIIINRSKAFPEPSIDTAGVGTALTGRHYTTIIKDDIVDDKNTNTPQLITDTIEWDASTVPLFDDPEDPSNEEIVIGTPWHKADVYSIKRNDPDYAVYIRHALEDKDGQPDYANGLPIFPERYPREKIEKIRHRLQNDELFFCQYMCDPRGGDSSDFQRDFIQFYERAPSNLAIFITLDPGSIRPTDGDFTAFLVCGVDELSNLYVLYRIRSRMNPRQIIDTMFDLYAQFPDTMSIGIETVAYQKSLVFYAREEMGRRNVFLPLVELKTDTSKTKEMRIRALIPRFSNKSIFLRSYMTDMVDELLDFPKGKHDDLIDALAYQLQLIQTPGSLQSVEAYNPWSMEAILEELSHANNKLGGILKQRLSSAFYEEQRISQKQLSN